MRSKSFPIFPITLITLITLILHLLLKVLEVIISDEAGKNIEGGGAGGGIRRSVAPQALEGADADRLLKALKNAGTEELKVLRCLHLSSYVLLNRFAQSVDVLHNVLLALCCALFAVGACCGEEITRDVLMLKVEHEGRVDGYAAEACLEVEVRTCGAAGVASESDGLSGADNLVGLDELLRHVAVESFEAVGVADDDVVTVAVGVEVNHAHFAVEGCADGVADIDFDVQTVVVTSPARSEGRVDFA